MKKCTKCNTHLPRESFRVRKRWGREYLISECKHCENIRIRASRKRRGLWFNQKPGLKTKARHAVNDAIKSGKLIKPKSCSQCGSESTIHGHHHKGYEHSLDVVWLCLCCHQKEHANR